MRNMRQVIKTNHNFVTGEHYEQRMLKPVQQAQNRVTIQLCDADTGSIIEEAVTENAISPCLESMAYRKIANVLNYDGYLNGNSSDIAFSTIALSDSDIGELEDPYFIHGSIVGFCSRTDTNSAGTNKYKGIYNSAESYTKIEDNGYKHIHLVYDWQTSAGNGKIQNIYWYNPAILSSYTIPPCLYSASSISYSNSLADVCFDRRGNAYKVVDGKYYKVLNFVKYVNGIESIKLATEESFHNAYEVNGYYYTFSSNYTGDGSTSFTATLTINKHDTNGNIVDTWNEDLVSSVPQLVELKNSSKLTYFRATVREYCDYDGWVGFQINFQENSSYKDFPTRNSDGELTPNSTYYVNIYSMYNVLTKQWLHVPSPWDVWCTYAHYTNYTCLKKLTDRHICASDYIIKVTSDDVEAVQYGGALSDRYGYQHADSIHSSLPIIIHSNTPYAITPIAAQTRLASPITKTSLNTMKIQYDFFFKIPLSYMTPEHAWDLYK
jgi:hypothetical protein